MTDDKAHLLDAIEVTKRFAGIRALSDVTVQADQGERVGLVGPNGAGKTTLFNCLYGVYPVNGGRVLFNGADITSEPMYRRSLDGMGRTFQRIELFTGMTVREHLLVAIRAHDSRSDFFRDLVFASRPTKSEKEKTDATLEMLGLTKDADRPIEAMPLGRARLVELGRALMTEPKLLFLDEPSSGLDNEETSEMSAVLKKVNKERNVTILLIEHDLEMVRSVVNRLYCLNLGNLIASGATEAVLSDETVKEAYLGQETPA